jgi:hypothetical protein
MSASRTAPAFDTIGIGFTTRSASTKGNSRRELRLDLSFTRLRMGL